MKFWGLIFTRAICRRVFPGPNFIVKEHEQGPHRGLFRLPGDLTEAPEVRKKERKKEKKEERKKES